MLTLCSIVVAILKMVTARNVLILGINSGLFPTLKKNFIGRHFQNGHHNTAQIQHCSISTSRIDSRHRKISTDLHFQNGHHKESIRVIIIYPHEMALKSDNVEFVQYCGSHFENGDR
jgi:hypothetical protein